MLIPKTLQVGAYQIGTSIHSFFFQTLKYFAHSRELLHTFAHATTICMSVGSMMLQETEAEFGVFAQNCISQNCISQYIP